MPTVVMKELSIEDVKRALAEGFGAQYKVTATSDSTVRVIRNPIWATVRVESSEGKTTFHIRPGGAVLVLAFNALYTVPRVHRVLASAFGAER